MSTTTDTPTTVPKTSNGHDLALFDAEMARVTRHKTLVENTTPWSTVSKLYPHKLDRVLHDEYHCAMDTHVADPTTPSSSETIQQFRDRLVTQFQERFTTSPPFTVLRLAEILQKPTELYSSADKFLRAVESVTCVSSTTRDFGEEKTTHGDTQDSGVHEDEKVLPVTVGDESQTILLSRVDWLSEDDLKVVEAEGYLADLTAPLEENLEEQQPQAEEETGENSEMDITVADDDVKKRRSEESSSVVGESPEKKQKSETSVSSGEEINSTEDTRVEKEAETEEAQESEGEEEAQLATRESSVSTDADETFPEDRMEESFIGDKTSNESVVMEDSDVGNQTLPEDKMDLD